MRVTVCQMRDEREHFEVDWNDLCVHTRDARSDLVLLPELPFARWFAVVRPFDALVWREAVDAHDRWMARLRELHVPFVMGTRPVDLTGGRRNEAFIATPARVDGFHHKRYLPDEEGFWEASWYGRGGDDAFPLAQVNEARIGVQVCTELWMFDVSRGYGMRGADIIAVPRATPAASRGRWQVGGRAAAIVSGAYCISSNRSGLSSVGDAFAGEGWIIDPDGEVLALTCDADRFVTKELDIQRARDAKATYPRYVR